MEKHHSKYFVLQSIIYCKVLYIIMNKINDLYTIEQEIYRESISDGMMEIFMGILLFFVSLFWGNEEFISFGIIITLFIFPIIQERIRKRFVYPRTGYVEPKSDDSFEFTAFIIFMITIFLVSGLVVFLLPNGYEDTENLYRVIPFTLGMVMFGPAFELSDRSGQDRYLLLGILPTISGLAITVWSVSDVPWSPFTGIQLFAYVWGGLFITLGLIRFGIYIIRNPVNFEEGVDNE